MSTAETARESEWTIGRLLTWTTEFLTRHGVDEARLAAEVLIAHAAECRRIDLYARFERILPEPQLAKLRDSVKRAAKHEPIAYLVGEKEFFSLPFWVTRDVLIPRPETETLVEWVIDHCRSLEKPDARLLDIGTGSGCIPVACLVNLPPATAVATDISAAALEVARRNAERHGVLNRLNLVVADRLRLPPDAIADGFDLLVSNPPYIPPKDVNTLGRSVADYEPRVALTDDSDGLSFYHDIATAAPGLLRPGGKVIVEIADGAAADVLAAATEAKTLIHVGTRKDRVTGRERALAFEVAGSAQPEPGES